MHRSQLLPRFLILALAALVLPRTLAATGPARVGVYEVRSVDAGIASIGD